MYGYLHWRKKYDYLFVSHTILMYRVTRKKQNVKVVERGTNKRDNTTFLKMKLQVISLLCLNYDEP